jgi:DNA repair exonuclease SbcCD ATPase subunit
MRVRRLYIQRLAGIPAPGFALEGLGRRINVIVGPNASGKTSLLRAFEAALYRGQLRGQSVVVEAELETKEGTLRASRVGNEISWQRDGQDVDPPPLPEERFLPCYTLRLEHLLEGDGQTDLTIAERINRELAGGYDVAQAALESDFKLGANYGRVEANSLRAAESALRQVQSEQSELRREEERLPALAKEKDEAEEAKLETVTLRAALALLDARRRRLGLEAKLALLPGGMDRLHGDEVQRLDNLRQGGRQLEVDLAKSHAAREQAEEALHDSGLGDSDLNEARLTDRRTQVNRLRTLEADIANSRKAVVEARAERGKAVSDLGGTAPQEPVALRPDDVRTTETALAETRSLKADLRALDAELERLPPPHHAEPDTQRLDEARRELIRWLSAPRDPKWTAVKIVEAALVLAAALAGVILAAAIVHSVLLVLLLPLFWAAYALLLRRGPGNEERRQAQTRFRSTAVDEPSSWELQQSEAHLWSLDRRFTDARILQEGLTRRSSVEIERKRDEEKIERALATLRNVAERVNYDPLLLDASFDRWLRLIAIYEQADGKRRQNQSALDTSENEARSIREGLTTFLLEYGEAPDAEGPDAEMLGQRVERLATRVSARNDARHDLNDANEQIGALAGQIERNKQDATKLFTDLDLKYDDEAGLRDRLARVAEWQKLKQELSEARGAEIDRQQILEGRKDLLALVKANDENAIRSTLEIRQAAADQITDIVREITQISTRIEDTERRRSLETARAKQQSAADVLSRALDNALFAEAGNLLMEQVETEHVQASRPAVLRRAEDWFARFTRHQWKLEFQSDGSGAFTARETATQERRSLAELSSGTRMQLLLAVRMAFALEAEQGREPLPLFLDEALTTADPERFQAAVESLTRLAVEQERQIIYLTARPDDAAFWRASGGSPTCIDLMESRRSGRAITSPAEITLPPLTLGPPEPGAMSAEDYAVAIGASPIAPWEPTAGVHLFYLLRDNLELLWRLLSAGIDRIGPLESLLGSAEADLVLAPEEKRRLQRRIVGAEAWIEAWRVGRGRPVDRAALEASGVLTTAFKERVVALAEKLQGDGRLLVERLKSGAVERFRRQYAEVLERWLSEQGYIAIAQPLEPVARERRTASAMVMDFDDPEEGKAEAQELARSLAAGVTAGPAIRKAAQVPMTSTSAVHSGKIGR